MIVKDGGKQKTKLVRLKELSRARTHLISLGLAPGNEDTLKELQDESKRPRSCSEVIPGEILNFRPAMKMILDPMAIANVLRSSGRGSAPDLSGTRYEHIRVLLDDEADWAVAALFLQAFTNTEVPESISACLRLGGMTALKKTKKGVRGIVAGSIIRRIATKTVAKN